MGKRHLKGRALSLVVFTPLSWVGITIPRAEETREGGDVKRTPVHARQECIACGRDGRRRFRSSSNLTAADRIEGKRRSGRKREKSTPGAQSDLSITAREENHFRMVDTNLLWGGTMGLAGGKN